MARRIDDSPTRHFIIGASDVAFILLVIFVIAGGESPTPAMNGIEIPFKSADLPPFPALDTTTVEVYVSQVDSGSHFNRIEVRRRGSESFISLGGVHAAEYDEQSARIDTLYRAVAAQLREFVDSSGFRGELASVDVYGDPSSFYGLVASIIAACEAENYRCRLIYAVDTSMRSE